MASYDVYNSPLGSIEVEKLDLETGEPLEGVTFMLEYYDMGNEEWYPVYIPHEEDVGRPGSCSSELLTVDGCLTTDETGVVVFESLNITDESYLNAYRVTEVSAPEGYLITAAPKEITLEELQDAQDYKVSFTLYNSKIKLPPMGSNSMPLFVTTGTVLIGASAFVYIYLKKRKKQISEQ